MITAVAGSGYRVSPHSVESSRGCPTSDAIGRILTALLALLLSSVAGADAGPGTATYRLSAGDQIVITVFGEPDLSMEFRLNDSGTLNYPFLGELQVDGITVKELEKRITDGLKGPYLVDPDVTVHINEYRPFFLRGEVKNPGGIPFQPGMTLQKAIALGGGFTERASRKKITVIRAANADSGEQSIQLNDPVHAGDVVTVHRSFF